ncbi:MAG TPA: glycoside hydrolase family 95 protein, partial [Sediminibacterium sp.]|nr:glycoside hydrolase family 95 protein [Sediminibacterium sp.]
MKHCIISIVLFLLIVVSVDAQDNNRLKLWYSQPANIWLEALPIGNGSLGAMVYGGVEHEHIQFNHQSLITGTTSTVGFYQPFGDVLIDFQGLKAENYRRELDISRSIQQVQFSSNNIQYLRESFVSYPDKILVFRITANKKGAITAKIKLTDAHQAAIQVTNNKITATGKLVENQMEYESQLLVKNIGGILTSDTSGISVNKADELIIFLNAGT